MDTNETASNRLDVRETPASPEKTAVFESARVSASSPTVSPAGVSPATVPSSAISTDRTRRRRARLRADGIRSVVYDLPGQLVEGLAAAATTQRLTPSEYLTRLVAGELVRTNAISLVGIRKEAS